MLRARRAKSERFKGAKYLKFRCTDCGNCCSDTIVPITAEDVKRLMTGEKLPWNKILEFYKSDEFDDGGEGLRFAELDEGRKVMGLIKKWDAENGRDACKFFKNNRCSVYESRPVTCRVWPFTIRFDDEGRISSMAINGTVACPYELDGDNSPQKVAADWNWDDRADEAWERQVTRWNKLYAGGTRQEFLKYIGVIK